MDIDSTSYLRPTVDTLPRVLPVACFLLCGLVWDKCSKTSARHSPPAQQPKASGFNTSSTLTNTRAPASVHPQKQNKYKCADSFCALFAHPPNNTETVSQVEGYPFLLITLDLFRQVHHPHQSPFFRQATNHSKRFISTRTLDPRHPKPGFPLPLPFEGLHSARQASGQPPRVTFFKNLDDGKAGVSGR